MALGIAQGVNVKLSIENLRYVAGYADKILGDTMHADKDFFACTIK